MTAREIVDSEAFKSIPLSAQDLWFHLFIRAGRDENGISMLDAETAARIRSEIGAGSGDVRWLLQRDLIAAEDGLIFF